MTLNEWLTIVALLLGPVLAILVAQWLDRARLQHNRKMDVFRTLMRTRRTPITAEHVGALNLIEIEFAGQETVLAAWKALLTHFATLHNRCSSETPGPGATPEEQAARNNAFSSRLADERAKLLAKLLHAIAQHLKFRSEQLEIFEGGYTPQGWIDVDMEQQAIRRMFVELYMGKRAMPIAVVDYTRAAEPEKSQEPAT